MEAARDVMLLVTGMALILAVGFLLTCVVHDRQHKKEMKNKGKR